MNRWPKFFYSPECFRRVLVTKLMSKNHVWNGFKGVDNYSEVHSTKKNFSPEIFIFFGRNWMLKHRVAKKTFNSRTIIFFPKFFFILLLLEGCLTKLTRKNFFSTYRVVFRSRIMFKKSKNGQKWLFVYFFLHICNQH